VGGARGGEAAKQPPPARARAPAMMEAHEVLATVCLKLGRLKEGIVHLREILRLGSGSCTLWTALADALFQDGQLDEAESAATRANEMDLDAAGPYSALALIHIVRNAPERAIAVLEAGFQRTGANSLLGMLTHQLQRACDWARWRGPRQPAARAHRLPLLGVSRACHRAFAHRSAGTA